MCTFSWRTEQKRVDIFLSKNENSNDNDKKKGKKRKHAWKCAEPKGKMFFWGYWLEGKLDTVRSPLTRYSNIDVEFLGQIIVAYGAMKCSL